MTIRYIFLLSGTYETEDPYPSLSDYHDYEPGLEFDDSELLDQKPDTEGKQIYSFTRNRILKVNKYTVTSETAYRIKTNTLLHQKPDTEYKQIYCHTGNRILNVDNILLHHKPDIEYKQIYWYTRNRILNINKYTATLKTGY